ncbi:SDR family oxidoreductase [Clostridium sp. MD294]|uniref:SDR family NAD(P)-dependent oxidoreductase n=1 Tax=Clostridium sp. MD294 TaxID=97138 RepID=UPI0002CAF333|nr:SDR family oxidoreductase [Clostridium sp. MD294]NDO46608.1 SDR family oxidoreductase [Clostridium sp. MD294]USF28960.1 putative oxidoreductase [Clostridium sp. MD294]
MKALITGATSGIGRDFAVLLSQKGYDLIIASRDTKKMKQVQKKLYTNVQIITVDLSCEKDCYKLYDMVKEQDIDIVINNAGFGAFGQFCNIPLQKELNMIDLNIKAVHILTKLFIQYFKQKDKGYIMNVSSSAAFLAGPLMATYYATKSYVLRLTEAVYKELQKQNSNIKISVLCPGPVNTAFNERANVSFSLKGMKSKTVAKYALKKMFEGKMIIIPGITMKITHIVERFLPEKLLLSCAYHFQNKKG